MKLRNFTFSVT